MKSIIELVEELINDIPADGREYTVFMSHDTEDKEFYVEITDECDEVLYDLITSSTVGIITGTDLFSNKWDWETKYKVVKPENKGITTFKLLEEFKLSDTYVDPYTTPVIWYSNGTGQTTLDDFNSGDTIVVTSTVNV